MNELFVLVICKIVITESCNGAFVYRLTDQVFYDNASSVATRVIFGTIAFFDLKLDSGQSRHIQHQLDIQEYHCLRSVIMK